VEDAQELPMKTTIDRRIYNDSVISKAIYWLSGGFTIARTLLDETTEELTISSKDGEKIDEDAFKLKLTQALNDFKLRQIVADETRDIKTILYAKAFADDEDLTEEDIHD